MKSSKSKRNSAITCFLLPHKSRRRRKTNGIGIIRKWMMKCSYAPAICLGFVILASIAAVCIFALPIPETGISGSGTVAAAQTETPSAENTDPDNAELYEDLQTNPVTDSDASVLYDGDESSENVTVYAAEGAECYHLSDCKFAFASSKRLTPYEAYYLGYRPCGRCNPPVYNPQTGKTE